MLNASERPQTATAAATTSEATFLPTRPLRRILLPLEAGLDPGPTLDLVAELARAKGAEIHLLHVEVFGRSGTARFEFPAEQEVASASWAGSPSALTDCAEPNKDPNVVYAIERGMNAAPAVVDYARENDVDLIVLPRRSRGPVARFFMGATTEEVVRRAHCSVLVFEADTAAVAASQPPSILCAVDLSESSIDAAKVAEDLRSALGGKLSLLHAVEPPQVPAFYTVETLSARLIDDLVANAEQELRRFLSESNITASSHVVVDHAARAILAAVDRDQPDLVVVGSRGLGGLPRLLLGSVAERVARCSTAPVLVTRRAAQEQQRA